MAGNGLTGTRDRVQSPRHLKILAHWLDDSIRLPGGFRIGWDGILGLVPGIGDLAGLAMSAYIIAASARLGATRSVLWRMSLNAGLEALLGSVPLVGDLFDFAFKANRRNLQLLEAHLERPGPTRRLSTAWLAAAGVLVCLCLLVGLWLVMRIAAWAFKAIA